MTVIEPCSQLSANHHRYEIMNNGSNSGHFWRDSAVSELKDMTKFPELAGNGALVHVFISVSG